MSRKIQFSVTVIMLLLSACTSTATPSGPVEVVGEQVVVEGGTYTDVSVAEMQTMLANKNFTLVNVHIPFEGDIPGTDLSIPYNEISQNLEKIPDKNAKIFLYCRSGRMSDIAAEELVGLGYTNIWTLPGGMLDWEKAGLEIER